jgi:hypothetical protein
MCRMAAAVAAASIDRSNSDPLVSRELRRLTGCRFRGNGTAPIDGGSRSSVL